MQLAQKITPCLWFSDQAEEAAAHYTGIFKNSRILRTTRYGKEGFEVHRRPEGSVMLVEFEIEGQVFTALNGGPVFQFNEAVSFQVLCENQQEVDFYWAQLAAGGDEQAQQCGWLKDKFGLSWQVIPRALPEWVGDPGSDRCQRAMRAMLQMKKIDMDTVHHPYQGSA
ncbi:MAG: VOC family protein [Thiobacillus sp.]